MNLPPIIGHERRWAALARAFDKGQIPGTLLITGPPHVGKATLVTRYAQLLLCPQVGVDTAGLPAPCGQCTTCHQVSQGRAMNLRVFAPIVRSAPEADWVVAPEQLDSSVIPIEMARKVADEALYKPFGAGRKVISIAQIDHFTTDAMQTLLKTFEEPPQGTHLVLTADNVCCIAATVLSRCWHLPLTRVPDAQIDAWLQQQFPAASETQLREAELVAAGRPGAAWRELDRLTAPEGAASTRLQTLLDLLRRTETGAPVAALGCTEQALKLAKLWWAEDTDAHFDAKSAPGKVGRASAARFLDELAVAARLGWAEQAMQGGRNLESAASRLDLIRKTRHYVIRNANVNVALDAMFGRMIGLSANRTAGVPLRRGQHY